MHYRGLSGRPALPKLAAEADSATLADQACHPQPEFARLKGGSPPGGGPPGGGGPHRSAASAARSLTTAAFLVAVAVLFACAAVIVKHHSQLKMRQCYEDQINALTAETQQLQHSASDATATSSRMRAACSSQAAALRAELSAGAEAERAALARADAAEGQTKAAQADAAAAKALAERERGQREALEGVVERMGLTQHMPITADAAAATAAGRQGGNLAVELRQIDQGGIVLLTVLSRTEEDFLTPWAHQVQRADISNTLVMTADRVVPGKARSLGLRALMLDPGAIPAGRSDVRPAMAKWAAISAVLSLGHSVLYVAPSVAVLQDPTPTFKQDSDLEAAADGEAVLDLVQAPRSQSVVSGEGQRPVEDQIGRGTSSSTSTQHVLVVPSLCPDLLFLRPTPAALALADSMLKGLAAAGSAAGRGPPSTVRFDTGIRDASDGTSSTAGTMQGAAAGGGGGGGGVEGNTGSRGDLETRLLTDLALMPALTVGSAAAPVRLRILPPTGTVVLASDVTAAAAARRSELLTARSAVAVLTRRRQQGGGSSNREALAMMLALGKTGEGRVAALEALPAVENNSGWPAGSSNGAGSGAVAGDSMSVLAPRGHARRSWIYWG